MLGLLWIETKNVLLNVLVKRQMKLEKIEVAHNMQKLFIHVSSLKLDYGFFECSFISNEMFSPYYPIKRNQ